MCIQDERNLTTCSAGFFGQSAGLREEVFIFSGELVHVFLLFPFLPSFAPKILGRSFMKQSAAQAPEIAQYISWAENHSCVSLAAGTGWWKVARLGDELVMSACTLRL